MKDQAMSMLSAVFFLFMGLVLLYIAFHDIPLGISGKPHEGMIHVKVIKSVCELLLGS